jgi:hypothetical protein
MKKMNKIYEAPKAEVIEIMNMGILMASVDTTGNITGPGGQGDA